MYTLRPGTEPWDLHPGLRCASGTCDPVPGFRDRQTARLWLQQFLTHELSMLTLRDIVLRSEPPWPIGRMTGEQILNQFADALCRGDWHVHVPPVAVLAGRTTVREAAAAAPPPPLPRLAPPLPNPPAPVIPTLPPNADAAAIAAVLKIAAEHGIPFCEECMKDAARDVAGAHA